MCVRRNRGDTLLWFPGQTPGSGRETPLWQISVSVPLSDDCFYYVTKQKALFFSNLLRQGRHGDNVYSYRFQLHIPSTFFSSILIYTPSVGHDLWSFDPKALEHFGVAVPIVTVATAQPIKI